MQLTLIGHMTVWIELDGVVILTDPWFGPHGWLERRLAPRTVPPALTPEDIEHRDAQLLDAARLRAIVASHNHLDHLDDAALGLAQRLGCAVVGSRRAAQRAQKAGVRDVISLQPGEQITLGGLTVHTVSAEHPRASDAVGYVLVGSQTCYFSGDTRFTPGLVADLEPFALDVALVQAACAHYPLLGDDGMSLPEAADLARTVRPQWTVPLHLHCAGKWLDRAAGLRIKKHNVAQVNAALERWSVSLKADGLDVKVLDLGQTWDTTAEG